MKINTKIKTISAAVAGSMSVMAFMSLNAQAQQAQPKSEAVSVVPTTQSTPVPVNPSGSGMSDAQIQAYFKQHGRLPGIKDMVWPSDKFSRSAGRFGELRGSRPHMGIDLSGANGSPLAAGDSGTVHATSSDLSKSAGYYVSVKRDNAGGNANLGHYYRYLHMKNAPSARVNGKVSAGEVLGHEGNSGAGIKDIHLHLDYAVPKSQARDVFLNNQDTARYSIGGVSAARGGEWGGSVFTDPTPYYARDMRYTSKGKDPYAPYLGTTWRWQFNTLYGTNLPTLPGSQGPTKALPQTTLTQLQQAYQNGSRLTPDEMAAVRQSMVGAAVAADAAGYDISGQWVSQKTLASFMTLDDGQDFATLPSETRTLKVDSQSPKEIISTIGNARFGNLEWVKAMQELNSKGLMTEFLMMQSEENFIREHNKRLKQRVEAMLATLTSGKLIEYSKKIQALQVSAEADVAPSIIELQLEASGDEYVDHIPYNGFDPSYNLESDNAVASNAGDGNPALRAITAARIAARNALPRTIGRCALYVRKALQAAGYRFTSQPSAYMYHTNGTLKKAGFTLIASGSTSGYTPQVGDIVVWHRTAKTPHGHIQIYDGKGKGWVSDFRHGFYVYGSQRTNFTIYRDLSAVPAAQASDQVVQGNTGVSSSSTGGGGRTCQYNADAAKVGIKHYQYPQAKSQDLVTFKGYKMHKDMVSSLKKMMEDAARAGAPLQLGSAFRSVQYQADIVNRKKKSGQTDLQIYTMSAPAGYSEHHTGFAVDFSPINHGFATTPGFKWLLQNASRYGFKQTFNKNYVAKTKVSEESWHWAWHGNEAARHALANSSCH